MRADPTGTPPQGGRNSREAAKDLIGLCEFVVCVCCFEVCRTSKLSYKGFNCYGAKLRLRCADFEVCKTSKLPAKGTFFVLFACTKSTKSTPEVCEPLDSGDDSNRRSIRCFCESDWRSSGNRLSGKQ